MSEKKENKMAKRRPGRDPDEMQPAPGDTHGDVSVVDVESSYEAAESVATSKRQSEEPSFQEESAKDEGPKIELNFKGSEILRAKFPKPFEVAEQIATDWVHDGRFEGLPLGHPLAQFFASKGLRKAKELEKKVMESPMTEKLAMQALTAGMKAQEIIQQVRAKVKK